MKNQILLALDISSDDGGDNGDDENGDDCKNDENGEDN
jgi:hypothetical protein